MINDFPSHIEPFEFVAVVEWPFNAGDLDKSAVSEQGRHQQPQNRDHDFQ